MRDDLRPTPPRLLCLAPVLLSALGACLGPRAAEDSGWELPERAPLPEPREVAEPGTPVVETGDGSDWVRLVSGEWIRGEIDLLNDGVLEFDSAELDDLQIDWGDVAEVRTARNFTLVLEGGVEALGRLRLLDEEIFLTTEAGTLVLARADVFRIVPGAPREANYWSGEVSFGTTARSGNTDQIDTTTVISLLRRTARSRLPIDYTAAYGELDGVSNTDNQRLTANYDWYLNSRLFVTPLGFELYRDQFQNIDLRASPYTGLGYTAVDTAKVEWNVTAGLGYRETRFDTVGPGEDASEASAIGIVTTNLSWDPSPRVEVDFDYSAQVGLEDSANTNQGATLEFSLDVWGDVDLDVRMRWDRVGQPQPDSGGLVPEKDDFRFTVGLSWSF